MTSVRTRLTHSLEVAQIGKSIVERLNSSEVPIPKGSDRNDPEIRSDFLISSDLVEFAALAHDIGHPPFGHNGEKALDLLMAPFGGFEGNAQSLRIISCMIKRRFSPKAIGPFDDDGNDFRLGINATFRSLGAFLKYDEKIIPREVGSKLQKGYYEQEVDLVKKIKENVVGDVYEGKFKTLECHIMDFADDIAYSSYDLEDALHAGFITPLEILKMSMDTSFLESFSRELLSRKKAIFGVEFDEETPDELQEKLEEKIASVSNALFWLYQMLATKKSESDLEPSTISFENKLGAEEFVAAVEFNLDGYSRSNAIARIVAYFIDRVGLTYNEDYPSMSEVYLPDEALTKIEALKALTTYRQIKSSKLKSVEYMGKKIVREIFEALDEDKDCSLLPSDWRPMLSAAPNITTRKRLICDYLSQMSDRYAADFHNRLFSTSPSSAFSKF